MIELNKIMQVRSISITPVTIKKLAFTNRIDLDDFLRYVRSWENTINSIKDKRDRTLGIVCNVLKNCLDIYGLWPLAVTPDSEYADYIKLLSNSRGPEEIYSYICDDRHVIEFEYSNPVRTKAGWELHNLKIWINDFKSEDI